MKCDDLGDSGPKVWDRTWGSRQEIGLDQNTRLIFKNLSREISFRGKSILELCSGSGRLSYLALRSGADRVTLVDFSEEALRLARNLFRGMREVEFIKADILNLSLPEKYDLVFSSGGVEHFKGKELSNAVGAHVKHSNGSVAIVVPSDLYFNRRRSVDPKNRELYGYWRPIPSGEMKALLEGQGVHVRTLRMFHVTYSITLPRILQLARIEPVLYTLLEPLLASRFGGLLIAVGEV